MQNESFSKNDTQYIKGIAIILMVIHHLFSFEDRISNVDYISLFSIFNKRIEIIIGEYGKICVSIFLFLAGYGMFYLLKRGTGCFRIVKKRLIKLLVNYWIIFALFVPIRFLFFDNSFNLLEFIRNLLALSSSYNGEWWFLSMYIVVVLLFATMYTVIDKLNNHKKLNKLIFIVFIILSISFIIFFRHNRIIIKGMIMLICYEGAYIEGYLIAKYNCFSILNEKIRLKNAPEKMLNLISIVLTIIIIEIFYNSDLLILLAFMLVTPIFIYNTYRLIKNSNINNTLIIFGNNSTNIWLIHTFFCYYYLQKVMFYPKFSLLIFFFVFSLSLVVSVMLNKLVINRISKYIKF